MVSIPDELLERLDERAREQGTTRSGLIQRLAAREVEHELAERVRRVRELLANPVDHGGKSAQYIREDRDRDGR